jgi:hypothetical protein
VSDPTNVVNMKVQARLIREAGEARAKRKSLREIGMSIIASPEFQEGLINSVQCPAPFCPVAVAIMREDKATVDAMLKDVLVERQAERDRVKFPGGIDDMEI